MFGIPNLPTFISHIATFHKIVQKFWLFYALTITLIVVASILSVIPPFVLAKLIDLIGVGNATALAELWMDALILIFIMIATQLGAVFFQNFSEYLSCTKSEEISHALRKQIFEIILHKNKDHESFFRLDTFALQS